MLAVVLIYSCLNDGSDSPHWNQPNSSESYSVQVSEGMAGAPKELDDGNEEDAEEGSDARGEGCGGEEGDVDVAAEAADDADEGEEGEGKNVSSAHWTEDLTVDSSNLINLCFLEVFF